MRFIFQPKQTKFKFKMYILSFYTKLVTKIIASVSKMIRVTLNWHPVCSTWLPVLPEPSTGFGACVGMFSFGVAFVSGALVGGLTPVETSVQGESNLLQHSVTHFSVHPPNLLLQLGELGSGVKEHSLEIIAWEGPGGLLFVMQTAHPPWDLAVDGSLVDTTHVMDDVLWR